MSDKHPEIDTSPVGMPDVSDVRRAIEPKREPAANAAVSEDSPLLAGWKTYLETAEYSNSFRWAEDPAHREGSMWAAYSKGWLGAAALAAGVRKVVTCGECRFRLPNEGRPFKCGNENSSFFLCDVKRDDGCLDGQREEG